MKIKYLQNRWSIIIYTVFGIIIWSGITNAQTPDATDILRKVFEANQNIRDFQATYQQKTSFSTGTPQVEVGKISRKGPYSRKDIQSPSRKIWISTPEKTIEKDINSGAINQILASPNETPTYLFQSAEAFEKLLANSRFSIQSETNTTYKIIGNTSILEYLFVIDKSRLTIDSIEFKINHIPSVWISNQYIKIESAWVLSDSVSKTIVRVGNNTQQIQEHTHYDNIKINQNIPDSIFSL